MPHSNKKNLEQWRRAFRFFRVREKLSQEAMGEASDINSSIIASIEAGFPVSDKKAILAMQNCFGINSKEELVRRFEAVPEEEREELLKRSFGRSSTALMPEHRLAFRTVYYHRNQSNAVLAERCGLDEKTVGTLIMQILQNREITINKVENFIQNAWDIPSLNALVTAAGDLDPPLAWEFQERFPSSARRKFIDFESMPQTKGFRKG